MTTQKNSGANLECLPRELLDDIFDRVRLDRIDAELPQLTDFISPALLPSIRPNLYCEIVVKSVASFMLLVDTIVNGPPELAQCIETLSIENEPEDENTDTGIEFSNDSTVAKFFTRASKIAELSFWHFPDLIRFLLTPYATANFLPEIEVLDIGILPHPSLLRLVASARQYKTLVRFLVTYFPEENGPVESSAQVEEMASQVEATDSDAGVGDTNGGNDAHHTEAARDQLDEAGEELVTKSRSMEVFLDAPMGRPEVVELARSLRPGRTYFLVDYPSSIASPGNPNFLPVLGALDPLAISYLSLRLGEHRYHVLPQTPFHPINSALSHFTNLQKLRIGAPIFSDDTLPVSLSSLAYLKEITFSHTASPSYSTLRSLISGPTKLKSLIKLDLQQIHASRGPVREPMRSMFEEDTYEPADGWSPGEWTRSFGSNHAQELILLAEAEGVDLGPKLLEDIVIEKEWMEEMDYAEEFSEIARLEREEEVAAQHLRWISDGTYEKFGVKVLDGRVVDWGQLKF